MSLENFIDSYNPFQTWKLKANKGELFTSAPHDQKGTSNNNSVNKTANRPSSNLKQNINQF